MTKYLRCLVVIFALPGVAMCHPEGARDFCSGVRRMYNQCIAFENVGSQEHADPTPTRGKAGPKGEKGDRGYEATIDYGILESMIQRRLENATRELMQEYAKMKLIIDKHSNEINEISKDLKVKCITDCSKVDSSDSATRNITRKTYNIFAGGQRFDASCDLSTDGGRWTVIQRRMNGHENFFRNHSEYVKGFGNVSEEFWIGLDNLYNILRTSARFELRIDMEDWDGAKRFAKYSQFDLGRPEEDYPLHVSGYSGNAGDSLIEHSGAKFSTKDRDLDSHSLKSCAQIFKGAWWYTSCHSSNLNGLYHEGGTHDSYADGVNWYHWKGHYYSLKFVEMKVRPSST